MEEMMVDIETTGTFPNRNAIIQIAAVKFCLKTNQIGGMFNASLSIPPTRHWDEGTREWWLKDKRETLKQILFNGRPARDVLREFYDFAADNSYRFWAKPVSFDFPFVSSYFHDFELSCPFDFRAAVDLRSWARGRFEVSGVESFDTANLPFEGTEHNALFDTLHQVKYALMVNAKTSLKTLAAAE